MGVASDADLNGPGVSKEIVYEPTPFGKEMLKHFAFGPGWKNLNHGSYGTFPKAIRDKATEFRNECESGPCSWVKFEQIKYLDISRKEVANILNVPTSTVVFVANATTGVNIVLRNMVWNPNGHDEIIQFNCIYAGCGKTTEYLSDANNLVRIRQIQLTLPMEDSEILSAFKSAIQASRESGHCPRLAIFDTVVSIPGIRLPFEALTAICHEEGVLSLVDGAHGVGHVELDLSTLDPDFFVSNCHKWLFAPRGCAVFYVPERNQALIESTLPTGAAYISRANRPSTPSLIASPNKKSHFVNQFEFTGTTDNTPYLCVAEAIRWRREVCGSEEQIRTYCQQLARAGGARVASILGTSVLDNSTQSYTACCLVNVRLPLQMSEHKIEGQNVVNPAHAAEAVAWMGKTLISQYKTFIPTFVFQGQWWARLSAQVYLDMDDFEWAGQTLKELCYNVGMEEFGNAV